MDRLGRDLNRGPLLEPEPAISKAQSVADWVLRMVGMRLAHITIIIYAVFWVGLPQCSPSHCAPELYIVHYTL